MAHSTPGEPLRAEHARIRERLSGIKQPLLVLSGKGGVGKSTVAAGLAVTFAARGHETGLLDVDLHGPSIPAILGLQHIPVESLAGMSDGEHLLPVTPRDHLHVMSIGFLLERDTEAVIWRGPMKHNVIKQFLNDVEWGVLDYLVVDSPPGTGDEPLTVAQLLGSSAQAIVVTTPQELAIADVRKSVSFCRTLGVPVLGVIENMSGFVCPHCGRTVDIFKSGGGRVMADEMDLPFLGAVPLDPMVVANGDAGIALSDAAGNFPAAAAFAAIADKIMAQGA
jgi:Mrp family chromosome partitioning ATPase